MLLISIRYLSYSLILQDVSNEGGITEIKTMNTQECVHEDTYDDDDSYRKKRKILLDNSPDFVYAKNSSLQKV